MKVASLEEFRKKRYPQHLTTEELDILNQIDAQKDIMFTDEELERSVFVIPQGETNE